MFRFIEWQNSEYVSISIRHHCLSQKFVSPFLSRDEGSRPFL